LAHDVPIPCRGHRGPDRPVEQAASHAVADIGRERAPRLGGTHRAALLTCGSGSFGLTTTRLNHVIHYDRHWNPAVESRRTTASAESGSTAVAEAAPQRAEMSLGALARLRAAHTFGGIEGVRIPHDTTNLQIRLGINQRRYPCTRATTVTSAPVSPYRRSEHRQGKCANSFFGESHGDDSRPACPCR
jgi:hypothetical protein